MVAGPNIGRRSAAAVLAIVLLASLAASCSLFLENGDRQCTGDGDCSAFPGSICDTSSHLCVGSSMSTSSSSGSGSGGGSCTGDAGCWACKPKNTEEFLNACTDSQCEPFDKKRLTHLQPDGSLPKLP